MPAFSFLSNAKRHEDETKNLSFLIHTYAANRNCMPYSQSVALRHSFCKRVHLAISGSLTISLCLHIHTAKKNCMPCSQSVALWHSFCKRDHLAINGSLTISLCLHIPTYTQRGGIACHVLKVWPCGTACATTLTCACICGVQRAAGRACCV